MEINKFCKANVIISILITIFTLSAYAVPMNISYQGFLLDNNGSPINGDLTISFNLYATDIDNQSLWNETHREVKITDGIFNVILGTERAFTNDLFDNDLYLGISIDGSTEMSPRRQLTSTAFSMRAREADYVKGSNISDHSIDITKLAFADQNGNIEISGNISANSFIGDGSQLTGIVKEDELKRNNSREYSGAFYIGVFDSLLNSNSSNLQDVLDDLDKAISNQTLEIESFKNEVQQTLLEFQKLAISIETGEFDKTTPTLNTGNGERTETIDVKFQEDFIEPPKVLASIMDTYLYAGLDHKLYVSVSDITKDGFKVTMRTWGNTRVAEVGVSWVALGHK